MCGRSVAGAAGHLCISTSKGHMFRHHRAVVTKADGSHTWVNMPQAGADSFLQDYSAGGGSGAIYRFKRVPQTLGGPDSYGYNQASPA